MKYPLILLLLLAIVLSGCRRRDNSMNGRTVFRYNESAGITSLDPAFARDQANIWADNQLYNGLLQFDEQLHVQPCIAYKWEISSDGMKYVFHLRKDVYFHDDAVFEGAKGRKVVASDFVFSLNRIVDPAIVSPGAWVMQPVAVHDGKYAFEAPNDSTLIIRLQRPFPPFASLLCMQYCSVIPREAVLKYGPDFRRHPIGTGPFMLGMWKEGVKLVLLKNPHYFESTVRKPVPFLDAVAVTFIKDKQTAFLEFVKGNLDLLSGIDASYKDELLTPEGTLSPKYAGKILLARQPYLNTEYLGILIDTASDAAQQSPLRNKLLRQAVSYGFDREQMMHYLRNNVGKPGNAGFVPSGLPFFDQAQIKGYHYDPERAQQLIRLAGYGNASEVPPIILTTNASYVDLCRFIQSQLNGLGLRVKIDITPPATLREMMAQSKVNFFRGSWIADYPDAENYLSLFYSPNFCPKGPNYTHFSSKDFDKLYEQSLEEANDSLRAALYVKMDNLVMEEAPVIVLYYDEVLRFVRKDVSGLGTNALNLLTLKSVQIKNRKSEEN